MKDEEKSTEQLIDELNGLRQLTSQLQMERLKGFRLVEQYEIELQALNNISQAAAMETSLDDLYRVIFEQTTKVMGSVNFIIALYDAKLDQIDIPFAYEEGKIVKLDPFPLGEGLTSILIRSRQPLMLVEDTENKAKALGAKAAGAPAKSWLGVPLIIGGEVLGAIIVQDLEHENRFNEGDQQLLIILGASVATSLRYLRLLEETRQQAERDRILAEVSGNVWASTNVEMILDQATQGLAEAFNASEATIELKPAPKKVTKMEGQGV